MKHSQHEVRHCLLIHLKLGSGVGSHLPVAIFLMQFVFLFFLIYFSKFLFTILVFSTEKGELPETSTQRAIEDT